MKHSQMRGYRGLSEVLNSRDHEEVKYWGKGERTSVCFHTGSLSSLVPLQIDHLTQDRMRKWNDWQILMEHYGVDINRRRAGVVIDSSLPHLMAVEDDVLSTSVVIYHLKVRRLVRPLPEHWPQEQRKEGTLRSAALGFVLRSLIQPAWGFIWVWAVGSWKSEWLFVFISYWCFLVT